MFNTPVQNVLMFGGSVVVAELRMLATRYRGMVLVALFVQPLYCLPWRAGSSTGQLANVLFIRAL